MSTVWSRRICKIYNIQIMIQFTCVVHKYFVALLTNYSFSINVVVLVNSGQIDIKEQDCMYDITFFINL